MKRTIKCMTVAGLLLTLPAQATSKKFMLGLVSLGVEGRKVISSLRDQARILHLVPANAISSARTTDRIAAIGRAKRTGTGLNTVSIEQAEIADNGDVIVTKFDLPGTNAVPSKIELEAATNFAHKDSGLRKLYQVDREYHNIIGPTNHRIEAVAIKEINGKTYRVIYASTGVHNNIMSEVSVYQRTPNGRKVVFVQTPVRELDGPITEGTFSLPENIKGEVVSVNVNLPGTQMSFITTEGHEYIYAVEKKFDASPGDTDSFVFMSKNKRPLPITNEALVNPIVFPAQVAASSSAATRGIKVGRESAR